MCGNDNEECRPRELYEPPDEVNPGGDTDIEWNEGIALEGADTIIDEEESAKTH